MRKNKKRLLLLLLIGTLGLATTATAFGASEDYYGMVCPGERGSLSAPKVTAETTGRSTINLSWRKVKGATGYVVYRSEEYYGGSNYKKVKTLYGNSKTIYNYKDCGEKNREYFYEIFAFRYKNGRKVYSRECTISAATGVVKPYISACSSSISSASIYARSMQAEKITFYRCESENGTFEKFAQYEGEELSVLDEELKFGASYYYRARASRKIDGKTYFSPWSDTVKAEIYNPYLDIEVTDFNKTGNKTNTFVYKLTSDQYNRPATIYREGFDEDYGTFDYSYWGEKIVGGSTWQSTTPVILDSYSLDGLIYYPFPDNYVLTGGQTIYLKFKSKNSVTYHPVSYVILDIDHLQAGRIYIGQTGEPGYSYDY